MMFRNRRHQMNHPLWTPLYGGSILFARFEGDEGGEAGETGEAGKGGGAAGEQGGEKKTTTPLPGSTITVKVDGKDVEVTMDELTAGYTKAAGADQKFEQAAEMRKTAATGVRITELAEKMKAGSAGPADVTEFVNILGGDISEMDMSQLTGGTQTMEKKQVEGTEKPPVISRDQLDESTRKTLAQAEEQQRVAIRANIESDMKKGVDSDEVLSNILKVTPESDREGRQNELYDMAMEIVRDRVVVQQQMFGPQMVKDISQTLRARMKRLGTPTTIADLPASQPGPGNQGMIPNVDLNKQTERKSSAEPDYIENVVERALQMQQKISLKGR